MDFCFQDWLTNERLEEYDSLFKEQKLTTLDVLLSLTSDDLRYMGIPLGDQKRILNSISSLKEKQSTAIACQVDKDSQKSNCDDSTERYRNAAEQGDAQAQYNLANCYFIGNSIEQNYQVAAKWFRKAADQGHAYAQFLLGVMFDNGYGVEQNYQEAFKWFRKAANQGISYAQWSLGVCYENGDGVDQDYEEAVKWYWKAANQGYDRAQYTLGRWCYEEEDFEEATEWYLKAAEQGNAEAQYSLGWCYKNGEGVEENTKRASKWFKKAADQGHEGAQDELDNIHQVDEDGVPMYCPNCGSLWESESDDGSGESVTKALLGGMLFGPIGMVGGAMLGKKKIVCRCNNCGLTREYRKESNLSNVVKQLY